jgi:hypothetical protein
MKKLLLSTAVLLAFAMPAKAAQIDILTPNPTSATGNFTASPGSGAFEDQVTFLLTGGPVFLTIANATNTFAGPNDAIQNWVASIWSTGVDGIVNNGDDQILFGPQAASACIGVSNCQAVGGSGIINSPGLYYAEFTGIGSGTSGYGGNISTFAVPGPIVGAGLPGLLAACVGLWGLQRRRKQSVA